jgi:hypothetical protein
VFDILYMNMQMLTFRNQLESIKSTQIINLLQVQNSINIMNNKSVMKNLGIKTPIFGVRNGEMIRN